MKTTTFFATHPVFTYDEFADSAGAHGSGNVNTLTAVMRRYTRAGQITRIRRGLYVTVPPGQTPETTEPDPYLVASRLAPDAVLAYHTALQFRGRAYSAFNTFTYLTAEKTRPLSFKGSLYKATPHPRQLVAKAQEGSGVEKAEVAGLELRVTSLERTLVDVLDRPDLSGGWEEVWRSLESVEYFHLDRVMDYALLLGNATTVAKVGFFLEQHADTLMVGSEHLERLKAAIPRQRRYVGRSRGQGRLVDSWNLIVPLDILNRSWEEPA
jgi:predicted transcriptional regulator of viral defense system